jgi:hypothetical protein
MITSGAYGFTENQELESHEKLLQNIQTHLENHKTNGGMDTRVSNMLY